jgi:cullin 4
MYFASMSISQIRMQECTSTPFKPRIRYAHVAMLVFIVLIAYSGQPEETKRTEVAIEGDRKHYLDAAIVRIMKSKKELPYEQLKTALIEAVKSHFVPEVPIIKQRIQSLVEQEYLKRDEDDMNVYVYVA